MSSSLALNILAAEFTPQERNQILLALSILMALVIVGGIGLMLLRRKLHQTEVSGSSADAGFSLSSLREMRDRGELTPDEYERARAKVVAKVKSAVNEPKKKPKDPESPPGA
jgi:hypothetical protein